VKKFHYQIRPQAEADLDDHARYIARDDLAAGLRLYDLAEETYEMLCDMPFMGAMYHTTDSQLFGTRYLPINDFPRYLVFYKPENKTIDIIRVLHARTDKDMWL